MIRYIFAIGLLFSCVHLGGQAALSRDSLVRYYNVKVGRYLDKDNALVPNYSINSNGITIYRDSTIDIHVAEYFLAWDEVNIFSNMIKVLPKDSVMHMLQRKGKQPFTTQQKSEYEFYRIPQRANVKDPMKPLAGIKIAIDPGHVAGDTAMGRVEDKFILFKAKRVPPGLDTNFYRIHQTGDSVEVHLAEGMLTWQVASSLAMRLQSDGATVLLTRKGNGITAFGKTFEQWKKDDLKRTLDSLLKLDPTDKNLLKIRNGVKKDDRFIFRCVFRDAELRKRAEIINAFHPDLTVVIHFNVDEKNDDWLHPTNKNFCMTFVGGAFEGGEMSDAERRFDFLRLLVTDDLDQSILASGSVAASFTKYLEVPLATSVDATYLTEHCVPTNKAGVFCRNLSLTRMIEGPIVFGETLYQDNYLECLKLSSYYEVKTEGVTAHEFIYPRLDHVVVAYENGILDYFRTH